MVVMVRCECPEMELNKMEKKTDKKEKEEEKTTEKEETKSEEKIEGMSPKEFFEKMNRDNGKLFEQIIISMAKGIAEAIVPMLDEVEVEFKRNRLRIHFK